MQCNAVPRFWSSAANLQRSSDLHRHSSPSLLLASQALVEKAAEEFLGTIHQLQSLEDLLHLS
jgi:hypothetical protein